MSEEFHGDTTLFEDTDVTDPRIKFDARLRKFCSSFTVLVRNDMISSSRDIYLKVLAWRERTRAPVKLRMKIKAKPGPRY